MAAVGGFARRPRTDLIKPALLLALLFVGTLEARVIGDKNDKDCTQRNAELIARLCTYPGQKWPCLHDSVYMKDEGKVEHSYDLNSLGYKMCVLENEDLTPERIINEYCCASGTCLYFCYDIDLAPPPQGKSDLYMNNIAPQSIFVGEDDDLTNDY